MLKHFVERLADNAKLYDFCSRRLDPGHELILGHYLRITSSDRLAKLCESLIAEIDGETFEGLSQVHAGNGNKSRRD